MSLHFIGTRFRTVWLSISTLEDTKAEKLRLKANTLLSLQKSCHTLLLEKRIVREIYVLCICETPYQIWTSHIFCSFPNSFFFKDFSFPTRNQQAYNLHAYCVYSFIMFSSSWLTVPWNCRILKFHNKGIMSNT